MGQRDKANATYDRAISLALKALQSNPRDAATLGNLGVFYTKKGDVERGLDYIRRAREMNPTNMNLIHQQAQIDVLANRMPEALQSLQDALSRGYSLREAFADPELKALRERPEFLPMAKKFEAKSGSSR